MSKRKPPEAPRHLSTEAKEFFKGLHNERDINDEIGRRYALTACESMDRMREAQAILSKQGLQVRDHNGIARPHPAIQIEKIAKAAMMSALRALGM